MQATRDAGLDRQRIERGAERIDGPVIDVGCGPGHWTDFLHRRGVSVQGVDLVPEFIDSARERFPGVSFRVVSPRISVCQLALCTGCSPGTP